MLNLKKLLNSSHIQIALAVGFSIIAFACFSKWILARPMRPMLLTIPPLIEAFYEGLRKKYKDAGFLKTRYWVCAIILSTAFVMFLHLV